LSATAVADAEDPGRQGLPTPSESTTLPLANGFLDARPASSDGSAAPSRFDLGRFDPRQNEILRVGGAFAVVLGLLLALKVVMRRTSGALGGAGRPSGVLEILARYPIARGQSLIVLKMARRVLLIHHAGPTMRTLSEVTDPHEVAALLGRMESGSRAKDADRFASALKAFESEHARLTGDGSVMPFPGADQVEVVDLTKSQMKGLGSLLGRRRMSA
jgi:flagellar biogenesis protein FliO